jgi:hypothetical protein
MVILPLSTSTLSLKFKTIFASLATFVALSAGVDDDKVGFIWQIKKIYLFGICTGNPCDTKMSDVMSRCLQTIILHVCPLKVLTEIHCSTSN